MLSLNHYNETNLSSHMTTLRTALTQATQFDVESGEATIRRLRAEARQRLEAASKGTDDLVTICRFDL